MNYLGLDIGDKRVGIAVSQSGILASGVETYNRMSPARDVEHIVGLVKQYRVDIIVAGLPKHLNGDANIQAEKNEVLCQMLRQEGCTIEYWDERLSSVAAEKTLISADVSRKKRKLVIDKLAAVIILQNYLDKKNGGI